MRVLVDESSWVDGFLDESVPAGSYRLAPQLWIRVQRIEELFVVRPASGRVLTHYVREFGVGATARKVMSRRQERLRNQRWLGVGIATVLAGPTEGKAAAGATVAFVAPRHPACMERVVLHSSLVRPWHGAAPPPKGLHFRSEPGTLPPPLDPDLVGWSPDSGAEAPWSATKALVAWLEGGEGAVRPDDKIFSTGTPIRTSLASRRPATTDSARPTAVLVGYGNYGKTQILPHVSRHLDVVRVYEIDPLQIRPVSPGRHAWDTEPVPAHDQPRDVDFIAGYHHTHAALAISAMGAGRVAVVEKPLATTSADASDLALAVAAGGRLFPCFQRRYAAFNGWLAADVRRGGAEPLTYISVVYEELVPAGHWYGWPNSRSRAVSNGCHWLDHFLWLNEFAEVASVDVRRARTDLMSVFVELENGSTLSLTMTSEGGSRFGMREYTEIRSGDRVARIIDGSSYEAEDSRRVLRRRKVNRLASYRQMYDSICSAVVAGSPGAPAVQIHRSNDLTLAVDAALREDRRFAL